MKFLIAALLTACSSCAHTLPVAHQQGNYARQIANRTTVAVLCLYPAPHGSAVRAGSGVAVGPGMAMTARHVVDCEIWDKPNGTMITDGEPWIIMVNGREFTVEKQGSHRREDAALLVANGGARVFERWASLGSDPGLGDDICHAPAMPFEMISCGPVTHLYSTPVWGGAGYFEYSAFGTPGNSGSGVYGSDGKLIGILVGGLPMVTGSRSMGYSVSKWKHMVPKPIPDLGL